MSDARPFPPPFTDAQKQALSRAWPILTEHFDNVLLVVSTEVEHGAMRYDDSAYFYRGSVHQAIGMAVTAQHEIIAQKAPLGREPER